MVIPHWHLQANLLFTTYYVKAIPAIIRANMDVHVISNFASKQQILKKIYPEFSALIKEDEFLELCKYATHDTNTSLISINHAMKTIKMV